MPLPTFAQTLGVEPPALLRKLDRKQDWGEPRDDLQSRVEIAVTSMFDSDESDRHSLFLVRSGDDLRRVAVALNSTRISRTQLIDVIAFLPNELEDLGLTLHHTPGHTRCGVANSLHRDLEASNVDLEALCRRAMGAGRRVGRWTKGIMTVAVQLTAAERCHAAVESSPGCLVEDCSGSLPAAPFAGDDSGSRGVTE